MAKIKNIIFDFGGVLVDWNPRYLYREVFQDENEMEFFLANVCNNDWNIEQDRGRPWNEAIDLLQKQYPEYHEAIKMYRDGWAQMIGGDFPETVALLRHLKGEGFKIYGLTNWSAETIDIAYSRFDFFTLFDGIVVSGIEKIIKPDERLYQILLDRYNIIPEESVFIDDNTCNITTANMLGINGIIFDNISNVIKRLNDLLQTD